MAAAFTVRPGTAQDEPFIAKSWLETLRSSHEARATDSALFSRHHLGVIGRVLRRPRVTVRVAAPVDDDFTVYGFCVLELPEKVHFTYVRKPWRRQGVARALLEGLCLTGMAFSTWSPDVQHWILEKYRLRYVPNWEDVNGRAGKDAA